MAKICGLTELQSYWFPFLSAPICTQNNISGIDCGKLSFIINHDSSVLIILAVIIMNRVWLLLFNSLWGIFILLVPVQSPFAEFSHHFGTWLRVALTILDKLQPSSWICKNPADRNDKQHSLLSTSTVEPEVLFHKRHALWSFMMIYAGLPTESSDWNLPSVLAQNIHDRQLVVLHLAWSSTYCEPTGVTRSAKPSRRCVVFWKSQYLNLPSHHIHH